MCPFVRAHWYHLANTIEIVLFFGPTESTTQTANLSTHPFLHRSRQSVVGHIGATWRIRLDLCFLRPTWVHNPNGKSIGLAVFAGLTSVTDIPTDRPTDHGTRSVTIGHICVRSTAMRPNNTKRHPNPSNRLATVHQRLRLRPIKVPTWSSSNVAPYQTDWQDRRDRQRCWQTVAQKKTKRHLSNEMWKCIYSVLRQIAKMCIKLPWIFTENILFTSPVCCPWHWSHYPSW